MKKIKLFIYLLALGLSGSFLTSCSEDTMDGINKNPNNPSNTDAKFMMAELGTSTAFNVVGGDFSFYLASYIEHETGIYNQLYNAEIRSGEPTLGSTFNNVWQNSVYSNIKTAKIIIAKCSEGGAEEGNDITLGAAKVMLAYNAAIITDLFGDAPYTEAGEINADGTPKYMQPKVDKQEDIYKSIFTHLNEAIVLFDGSDSGVTGSMGGKDFLYSGNSAKWKKAAYALKARYTMRLLNRSTDKTTDLNNILDYINKSFASTADEFKFAQYDGGSQLNPLFSFTYSRDYMAASQSLVDKLLERNDPRYNNTFYNFNASINSYEQVTDATKLKIAPNGTPEQLQYYYSTSLADLAITAPTMLLSYHELLFLKAEALARLGRNTEAESALKEAITVAFANFENSVNSAVNEFVGGDPVTFDADISTKYYTESVKPLFDVNPLKEVMIQKYLAFYGASGESVEAYNDYRRLKATGENFITLNNPKNTTQFPLRLPYGSDEMTANENVKVLYTDQGNYVYTEPVWWAGGTR
ncbi:SusD/RagB family nutrient-binding outer membrane lipoprotein [Dysgonomonas macrotermitis]|uniref:Starch-binding associating with outer membrane n=1 Tax=Dysgonomonas macrotermitis TaxID=1346286 RepID=A0A1M4TYY4_9BACT|nr:SusD/RagB family nutrient-binding outer membrane lipoprotein [Dysgonomonas macrotermitis]SHE49731.1 Starch-binding associating with outer membrane [Dysgonomonas macrotermitis]